MENRNQKARVAIPSGYYKIFLRQKGDEWHSIASMLEHNSAENGASWEKVKPVIEAAIVKLEAVERIAETTFHPNLDRDTIIQNSVDVGWDLSQGRGNLEFRCKS